MAVRGVLSSENVSLIGVNSELEDEETESVGEEREHERADALLLLLLRDSSTKGAGIE